MCVCIGILPFFMSLSQSFTVFCLNFQNKSIPCTQILQVALLRGTQTTIWYRNYWKYIGNCKVYQYVCTICMGVSGGASAEEPACQCRSCKRRRSEPGSGRAPGGGHGRPLQRSCLENPMDRGVCWATVHGVTQSWTWLKQLSTHTAPYVYMR